MDYLDAIMQRKRREMAERARPVHKRDLAKWAECPRVGPTFQQALAAPGQLSIIAEIKRRSPSAGTLSENTSIPEQVRQYYNAGADAISVLTDGPDFGGNLRDLWEATDLMISRADPRPCLRKDFTVHPLQILEAAEAGARAILLIVRALDDDTLKSFYDATNLAGLDTLFEIHSESDLERALAAQARIIGVNNRDLADFTTDLTLSQRLLPQVPANLTRVSESGIHTPDDAQCVRQAGADAILIGEALMTAESPLTLIKAIKQATSDVHPS